MGGQKEAERSHEMKNGPPKAQGSCEAWRLKEKRTSGDITDLQSNGEGSEIGGELKFSYNLECCVECNRSGALFASSCKSVADCDALLWRCCGVCMHQTMLC